MNNGLSAHIRAAFLERVPLDTIQKTESVKQAMRRFGLKDEDLIKHMQHAAIKEAHVKRNKLYFIVEIRHAKQLLALAYTAEEDQDHKNSLVFWLCSIRPLV